MAKSEAYARISCAVLAMVDAIPEGRVSTYRSLGEHIDVMPRQVAYILATLSEQDWAALPWQRIVAESGKLSETDAERRTAQIARLLVDGIEVDAEGSVVDFAHRFIAADSLASGVPRRRRDA